MATVPDARDSDDDLSERRLLVGELPHVQAEQCPDHPAGACWRIWCPFCRTRKGRSKRGRWHHHGAGPGHRVAHCDPDDRSPFTVTGYVLVSPISGDAK